MRRFSVAPSGRSSRTIFSGAFWSYGKSCRPSARSGNHKLYRHINDASDESKLARADSEGTDNPEAIATQKDVSQDFLGPKTFFDTTLVTISFSTIFLPY